MGCADAAPEWGAASDAPREPARSNGRRHGIVGQGVRQDQAASNFASLPSRAAGLPELWLLEPRATDDDVPVV